MSVTMRTAPVTSHMMVRTIARAAGFVVLFLVAALAAGSLLPTVVRLRPRTSPGIPAHYVVLELVAALAATAIMVRAVDAREWSDVGLGRAAARARALILGWCAGIGAIALTCTLLFASGLLVVSRNSVDGSWIGAALRVTIVLLPAALAEELLCRGYLLSIARDAMGIRGAVVATSVLFGLVHLSNAGATAESVSLVTLAGIFLATVRVATNSLYAAWMAHVAWNWFIAVPLHAAVSGVRFESPGYDATSVGPAWLSGGPWGPEGGAVAAIGMLGVMSYLYTRPRREES